MKGVHGLPEMEVGGGGGEGTERTKTEKTPQYLKTGWDRKPKNCGHCLVTLSLTINETLKWLSSLPILMQKSFWW